MTPNIVLWIYIVLLVAGGLMGFLKAKSKMSLIMSLAFGIPLALCALDIISMKALSISSIHLGLADILIFVLLLFFGMRFIKGRKFMPAGLMSIASLLAALDESLSEIAKSHEQARLSEEAGPLGASPTFKRLA